MVVESLAIPEVKLFTPKRFGDHRGYFSETYSKKNFQEVVGDVEFVQDNQSYSAAVGTLRGLHFQIPPFAQAKLVRVLRGAILDVVVDIRTGSPTYGKYVAAEISAKLGNQLFVPVGFAHGLLTIEPDTEVFYKVTNFYAPECDRGLLWSDPQLAISWPMPCEAVTTSEKDTKHPCLAELPDYFHYRP
jgi:dTDP-4-dehydrorhamnose 3,5-epimerase